MSVPEPTHPPSTPFVSAGEPSLQPLTRWQAVGHVVAAYAVFSAIWILVSDQAVLWISRDPEQMVWLSEVKGWLFVVVTSLLLFATASRQFHRHGRAVNRYLQARRVLEAIVNNSNDAIYAKDATGRYLIFNRAAAEHRGLRAEDVIGRRDHEVFPAALAKKVMAWDERVLATGVEEVQELELKTAAGPRSFVITTGPLRDVDGAIFGVFGVGQDVTATRQALAELKRHREHLEQLVAERTGELEEARVQLARRAEEAEAATRAKTEFLAHMSHEIRTPMNTMIGAAQLLRREDLTPTVAARVDHIDGAARHLLGIVDNILDLSKIEAGRLVLERQPVFVAGIVSTVAGMIADRAATRGLRVILDVGTMADDLVGDPTRLRQALLNYMNNAVKFTDQGEITVRVRTVGEDAGGALVRFEVQDTGPGITPEVAARLFTPFQQGDRAIGRGGTGLGLVITRRLAELMGGEVGVETRLDVGSTFWFTARLQRGVPLSVPPSVDVEAVLRRQYRGRRVLVAEDEPVNREVVRALLEDVALVVDVAEDGKAAVERATRTEYALVLMDMQMPRLDGLGATRAIRAAARQVPIVAMTANAFAEDRVRCTEAGMNDFLTKPTEPAVLYRKVLRWLEAGP